MYREDRKQFDERYHPSSIVEAVYAALKAMYGGSLRTRTPKTQTTEVMMRALNYNIEMVARAQTNAGGLTEADIRAVAACQNKAQAAAHVGDAAHRMSGLLDMGGLAGRMEPDGLQDQYPNEPEWWINPRSRQTMKDPDLVFCWHILVGHSLRCVLSPPASTPWCRAGRQTPRRLHPKTVRSSIPPARPGDGLKSKIVHQKSA